MIKSLKARGDQLADIENQLKVFKQAPFDGALPSFKAQLEKLEAFPLRPTKTEIFQINVGYMCNQVCKHCHVDAGPDRKEIMSKEHLQRCLDIVEASEIPTIDLTGGAPEMNPHFRWFVEQASAIGVKEIIVRSNLTIIRANPKYHDLPDFFKAHGVHVVSSLPYYQSSKTDAQRGDGVFDKSIEALKMLNAVGYGTANSDLQLDLVYNPAGAFLPGDQAALEQEFKRNLKKDFGIEFNQLFTITNLPISRFLDYLIASGNYEEYMDKLVTAFNPAAVQGVMCRNTLSVDWDGFIYDCDFNQMLQMKVDAPSSQHINDFDMASLGRRAILVNQHCYGCTAGAGSSCQGTVT
ncbi:MAG: radical SAM protein [Verrucomicrobia bacterium]|nr:radical SAM protein [Verrucomicrobiota bacterium]|tara:strand:- start:763 stop:1815 length:1053 start_codon:yes stop_codon:yes gene_type:complete